MIYDPSRIERKSSLMMMVASLLFAAILINLIIDKPGHWVSWVYPNGFYLFSMLLLHDLTLYRDTYRPELMMFFDRQIKRPFWIKLVFVLMMVFLAFTIGQFQHDHDSRMKAIKYGRTVTGVAKLWPEGSKNYTYFISVAFDHEVRGVQAQTFQLDMKDYARIVDGQKIKVVYLDQRPIQFYLADYDRGGVMPIELAWMLFATIIFFWLWYSFKGLLNNRKIVAALA